MNKLDTSNNGGMPVELDDLEWLDTAYRDAWKGLLSAFGNTLPTSFKLSGCIVTVAGNTYSWTAGYIALEGEILKVDAGSVTVSNMHSAKWLLQETYDISGNDQFFDTNSYDTYQIRRGILVDTPLIAPPPYMIYNAPYLRDIIQSYFPTEENWHNIGDTLEPSFQNSWDNYNNGFGVARFKKDVYGWVCLEGMIVGGIRGAIAFTLSYHLNSKKQFNFYGDDGVIGRIDIDTNGNVYINAPSIAIAVCMDGIRFRLD